MKHQDAKPSLSDEQLELTPSEKTRRKKSAAVAYFLFSLFGFLGVHQFYLGKKLRGSLYLLTSGLVVVLYFSSARSAFLVGSDLRAGRIVSAAAAQEAGKSSETQAVFALGFLFLTGFFALYDLFTLTAQTKTQNLAIEKGALTRIKRKG